MKTHQTFDMLCDFLRGDTLDGDNSSGSSEVSCKEELDLFLLTQSNVLPKNLSQFQS
jgi:hypothetical protein